MKIHSIFENMIKESLIKSAIITNIEDDDVYDNLMRQIEEMPKEISFAQAEPFGVLLDGNKLAGVSWLDTSGNFDFHMQLMPAYRSKGYSKQLFDDLFAKYEQMKSYRGEDYKVRVTVVNSELVGHLQKYYNLKVIQNNGSKGVIMGN